MTDAIQCRVCKADNEQGVKNCSKCGAHNPGLLKPNYGKGCMMSALLIPLAIISALLALL